MILLDQLTLILLLSSSECWTKSYPIPIPSKNPISQHRLLKGDPQKEQQAHVSADIARNSSDMVAETVNASKSTADVVLVLANLAGGIGHLCESTGWRGELGRFIAAQQPQAKVIVWDSARHSFSPTCFRCFKEGLGKTRFDCDEWMKEHNRTADALLLVGAGTSMCSKREWGECTPFDESDPEERFRHKHTALYYAVHKPWVRDDTWVAHIPVSNVRELVLNEYGFDSVVHDYEFLKPVSPSVLEGIGECSRASKEDVLVYPARFSEHDHKGQAHFLQHISPRDLDGFAVEFYGFGNKPEVFDSLLTIARERNITARVLGQVSQEELLRAMCRAKGVVLCPRHDSNPRVVYEAVLTGCPVYVCLEANVPEKMLALPFVFSENRLEMLRFPEFMRAVVEEGGSPDYFRSIQRRSSKMLRPEAVYGDVVRSLGLCAYGFCPDGGAENS